MVIVDMHLEMFKEATIDQEKLDKFYEDLNELMAFYRKQNVDGVITAMELREDGTILSVKSNGMGVFKEQISQ